MFKNILITERLDVFGDIIALENPYLDLNYNIVADERIFYSVRDKITLFNNVKYSHDIKTLSNSVLFDIEYILYALDVFSIYGDVIEDNYKYIKAVTINDVSILDELLALKKKKSCSLSIRTNIQQ